MSNEKFKVKFGLAVGDTVATVDGTTGDVATIGQYTSTQANNTADGEGQIFLNGANGNRVDWNTNGLGAPAFTTRSTGTKAVLYPSIGASSVDYALGVEAGGLWSSVPGFDAGQLFKWYGGTTQVASLSGTGNLILAGTLDVQGGTITDSTGALSITTGASNGAITLDPNGTGNVVCTFSNGGNLTNDRNYVHGSIRNATTRDTNGDIWELNTSGAQSATNPYFRGVSLDNSADTTRGPLTLMRSYAGATGSGSASRGRLLFEKARGTAASPTAVQSGDLIGSIDATGYTSTGWLNDTVGAVPAFFGFSAAENWVSNTALGTTFSLNVAPSSTTISSGANLIAVLSLNPQSATYRSDVHTFTLGKSSTTQLLDISGVRTSSIVPIKFPAFLSTAVNGTLATTGASGTGSVATLTFGALASAPYTVGSTITVAGVTPAGYNGGYTVTACNTTSVSYASTTTGAQTVAGTITVVGAIGWQIAISDSAGGSNPNGMMAFWDTTHNRFSYIHDNSAV